MAFIAPPVGTSPPGWFPDPYDRRTLRWWDGRAWTQHVQPAEQPVDPGLAWLIPIGRSPLAIAAGYAGLFAVLVVFAPFALLLGVLAVLDIRHHPGRLGMGRAVFGIVMGGLFSLPLVLMLVSAVVG